MKTTEKYKNIIKISLSFLSVVLLFGICSFIYGLILLYTLKSDIDLIIKPNNKIIKSTYNVPTNSFSVIYVKNNDTLALDYLHPIELDSLINHLNNNPYDTTYIQYLNSY